jgi:hypothetical protein
VEPLIATPRYELLRAMRPRADSGCGFHFFGLPGDFDVHRRRGAARLTRGPMPGEHTHHPAFGDEMRLGSASRGPYVRVSGIGAYATRAAVMLNDYISARPHLRLRFATAPVLVDCGAPRLYEPVRGPSLSPGVERPFTENTDNGARLGSTIGDTNPETCHVFDVTYFVMYFSSPIGSFRSRTRR